MSHSPWTLDGHSARLTLPGLHGRIDLSRPDLGLGDIAFQGHTLAGQQALGVDLPKAGAISTPRLADAYVRGADLVATYCPTDSHPLQIQIYWRLTAAHQLPVDSLGLDLVVSAQTALLDTPAQVLAVTRVRPWQTLRLATAAGPLLETLEMVVGSDQVLDPAQGPGCLLFRSAAPGMSYVEMIHPADFRCDTVTGAPGPSAGEVRLVHRLFEERLEKGVILRARMRGVWLSGDDDTAPTRCYALFAAAALPLTT